MLTSKVLLLGLTITSANLMSDSKEQTLRSFFPKVYSEEITAVLNSRNTILYTTEEIPPAYQDWEGALPGVHDVFNNKSSDPNEPFGNANREFPWGKPGGTHNARGVKKFGFVYLPIDESTGRRKPIVYFKQRLSRSHTDGYSWIFPKDAVVGEVLMLTNPRTRENYTFELRVRIREYGEWSVDVFRPFPRSVDLAQRIKEIEPNWKNNSAIASVVNACSDSVMVKRVAIRNRHPKLVFESTSWADEIGNLPDHLVHQLLLTTEFKSCLGEEWRKDVPAPYTNDDFSIVPVGYSGYFLTVDRTSCMDCHESVNKSVDDFQFRDWYGRVRGSDGIFSFHPFARSSISSNGSFLPVRFNGHMYRIGMIAPYDRSKHDRVTYTKLTANAE